MPRYKVSVSHIISYDVEVEADNEDDAENEAIELVSTDHPPAHTEETFDIEGIEKVE